MITGLPEGTKNLEIWLPQGTAIILRGMTIDEGTTALIEPDPRTFLH